MIIEKAHFLPNALICFTLLCDRYGFYDMTADLFDQPLLRTMKRGRDWYGMTSPLIPSCRATASAYLAETFTAALNTTPKHPVRRPPVVEPLRSFLKDAETRPDASA